MEKLITDFRNLFGFKAEGKPANSVTQEEIQGAMDANTKAQADIKAEQDAHTATKASLDAANKKVTDMEATLKTEQEARTKAETDFKATSDKLTVANTELDKYIKGSGAKKEGAEIQNEEIDTTLDDMPHNKRAKEMGL